MASDSTRSRSATMSDNDAASKRKRANRLAKLKQCKLEAMREHWLANQVQEKQQGYKSLHAAEYAHVIDPGQVLNPNSMATEAMLPVLWASPLHARNSTERRKIPPYMQYTARIVRTQAEPADPDLLRPNCACINRPGSCNSPSIIKCADNADVSPKLCEDRSPKSKASKMGKGLRRPGNNRCNSKENECTVAELRRNKVVQQTKLGTQAPAYLPDRPHGYVLDTEYGWEAAVDMLGLHSAVKKPSSDLLRLKVSPCHDQQHAGTNSTLLLGTKLAKKTGFQHSVHQRAQMRDVVHRPTSLPILQKQQRELHASSCASDPSDKPQCPICTEDLDSTDTLFDSCPCGYSLCLFCYHKIAVENGRCPACRGVYSRDITAKPAVLLPR